MCISLDLTTSIHFGSSGFISFNSCALVPPRVLSPENSYLSPPIALDDGWSLFTSGLQDFENSTLLCTQGLSLVHLTLDPTVVGPPCLDITDWVCSSPICFLHSLDVDRTIQISSFTANLKDSVAPPLEILTSSDLEDFCQCSKASIFELSPCDLDCLGLACALKHVISSDF
jgi:hypothetical protein